MFAENFQEAGVTVSMREVPATYNERLALAKEYAGHAGQSVVFFHNVLMGESFQVIPGMKNVALPAYEFSRIYDKAVVLLNQYDEIWTTTSHVTEVLINSGVTTPIQKVPPALDRKNYPRKSNYAAHKPFRFLFIGEPHFRKGVHFLMYGFVSTFPDIGEAELLIKTGKNPTWAPLREDIRFITERLSRKELLHLYCEHDCYISASLAEGLGLPVAEAILCGLPVCTNYWGGHRDMIADGGYFPLSFVEAPRPWTGEPQFYTPGQNCAISDETAVASAMKAVMNSTPEERQNMAYAAEKNLKSKYGKDVLKSYWKTQVTRLWKELQ